MSRPTLALAGLTACSGCQLTLLNCEPELPEILSSFEVRHFAMGGSRPEPGASFDLALVEGAVSTPQDLETLFALRSASRLLVALGTCARHGGVAAMNNLCSQRPALVEQVYGAGGAFSEFLPSPLTAFTSVDFDIVGCPPEKEDLLALLGAVLAGTVPPTTCYPVCLECRSRENLCLLLERNEPCLGPIIQGGCNARCPATGIVCEGCRGPVQQANVAQELELLLQRNFGREEIGRRLSRFAPRWNYDQRR